jgi:hypothetical protein
MTSITETEKSALKFIWKQKKKKKNSQEKSHVGGITFPTSKYTTEPQQKKQHGTGIRTDIKISGSE